ncbi:hypothetical protein DFS34DRAFT_382914 [Phlyctochytrium arcticum]|nr:hypothetical protein DFS34DRAFT_382914 [Phlyctochytrium arcticum]
MNTEEQSYVCTKTSFRKAFAFPLNEDYYQKLRTLVKSCHELVIHATHVFKLYYLHHADYEPHYGDVPKVSSVILYLLNDDFNPRSAEDKALVSEMRFTIARYRKLVPTFGQPRILNVQQLNTYLSRTMATNVLVNVQQHFSQMAARYINHVLGVKNGLKTLRGNKAALKTYRARIRHVKELCLRNSHPDPQYTLLPVEEDLVQEFGYILPYDEVQEYPLAYNLVAQTQSFVPAYCRLAACLEAQGFPLFSALPLRRKLNVAHLPIDTRILCLNLLGRPDLVKNMSSNKGDLWGNLFRLSTKPFKPRKGYRFAGWISTDCTSVTVYFEPDVYNSSGRPRKVRSKKRKRQREKHNEQEGEKQSLYFQNHLPVIASKPNFVVADPNKRDLLYCRDNDGNQLRYTSMQRRLETRTKKYTRIIDGMRTEAGVAAWESMLPTSKSMSLDYFETYLEARNVVVPKIQPFYDLPIHNKLKFNRYINTQRSEQKFVTRFRRKFGKDAVLILGDWSDGGHTLRYNEPSKTTGWLRYFKQQKIVCYLIDDFRTSKLCPQCEQVVEPMLYRDSPRPWIRRKSPRWGSGGKRWRVVHGLLVCQNLNCAKQARNIWNRDDMSTTNMLKIVNSVLAGDGRPENYSRSYS